MSVATIDLVGLTADAAQDLAETLGYPRYRGRQVFTWVQAKRARSVETMTDVPRALRGVLGERAEIGRAQVARMQRAADGTRKFLLRLGDGEEIESVLIPDEDRLTACISSQVGCPLACRFCLTGLMGMRRNLSAAEIVGEILLLQDHLEAGERLSNVVLMGMGEPLLNFAAVEQALHVLADARGAAISPRRITLSTAGHVPGIRKLAASALGVNLALSLSATTDAVRDAIMPINRRWPIAEVLAACREYPLPNRRRLSIEYVLLGGVNDALEDARRLVRLLHGIRCKVNLIPFNTSPDLPDRASPRSQTEAFQRVLHDAGMTATIRESRGWEISAACGMLRADAHRDAATDC